LLYLKEDIGPSGIAAEDFVKVMCAWCVKEGEGGFLREKPPFEDASETHGMCLSHFHALRADLNQTTPATSRFSARRRARSVLSAVSMWIQAAVTRKI